MERTRPSKSQLKNLTSAIVARATLAARMGQSYDGARDLYKSLGYPVQITFEQYLGRYNRQDMAKRLVHAYSDACWRKHPKISEGADDEQTEFEKAWDSLVKEKSVYHFMHRIDRISGIGQYGVLLLGFDDGRLLSAPVEKAKQLLFMRPCMEGNAKVKTFVENVNDPRYGMPLLYQITTPTASGARTTKDVHYSRIIHVAEGLIEDEVFGTPRLECVFNRLQDIELLAGGSAEMFWRGAFPGISFEMDKDAYVDNTQALEDEIEEYVHGLKRYLRLQGMKANSLSPQITDPRSHLEVQIRLISAATGIPQRILVGSERGELASSQDATAWDDLVEERRTNFVTDKIIRPFIDKLIEVGVLPTTEEYEVKWASLHVKSEKERAEIAGLWANAIADYVKVPGTNLVVPEAIFLKKFLEFDQSELAEINRLVEEAVQEEKDDMEEERALQKEDQEFSAELQKETAIEVAKAKPVTPSGSGK